MRYVENIEIKQEILTDQIIEENVKKLKTENEL